MQLSESIRAAELRRVATSMGCSFACSTSVQPVRAGKIGYSLEFLADFLRHSAPPEQIEEFLQYCSSYLLFPGEMAAGTGIRVPILRNGVRR
jgi:hypothetical protein